MHIFPAASLAPSSRPTHPNPGQIRSRNLLPGPPHTQHLDSVVFRDVWKAVALAVNYAAFNDIATEALFSMQVGSVSGGAMGGCASGGWVWGLLHWRTACGSVAVCVLVRANTAHPTHQLGTGHTKQLCCWGHCRSAVCTSPPAPPYPICPHPHSRPTSSTRTPRPQGSRQFDADVSALAAVFGEYTSRPAAHFKETKEACRWAWVLSSGGGGGPWQVGLGRWMVRVWMWDQLCGPRPGAHTPPSPLAPAGCCCSHATRRRQCCRRCSGSRGRPKRCCGPWG